MGLTGRRPDLYQLQVLEVCPLKKTRLMLDLSGYKYKLTALLDPLEITQSYTVVLNILLRSAF